MGQLTDLPAKGNGTAMGAFGDRLRREREMRGITLDEITESTKISRRHLEALEGEHFDQLPGGVFNKGFVRAYARFLGIDEDQAVADYSAASNELPEPENKFPLEVHEEPDRDLNPRRSNFTAGICDCRIDRCSCGLRIFGSSPSRIIQKRSRTRASQRLPVQ